MPLCPTEISALFGDRLLTALCRLFEGCPAVVRAVLFGSRARGDHTELSDYDIAVYGAPSQAERARLKYACREELPTLHKIDLLFADEIKNEKLLSNIQKEGVSFYVKVQK